MSLSSERIIESKFEEHPYTYLFPVSDPAGAVVFRTDVMQQVVCSPRGGELVRAFLSGETGPDALPPEVRGLLAGSRSGLPASAGDPRRGDVADVHTLYLVPTLDCQLRCGYCRITRKQGRQAGHRLSPESACDAIDRVLGPAPSGVGRTVVFFGGEPLLVPETVFSAIRHIRGGPEADNTDIMLQTNAVAIDVETAEFLAANDVFVLVSLDGVGEVHDRHRRLSGGGGSYELSVAGYRNAKERGCSVGVSATATAETVDRFAESFEAMLTDLLPDKCGVGTHLHPLTGARSPHQASPEAAARILIETYLAARRLGIYHHQMCERIGPFLKGTWRRYSCAGCGGKVVVAPNGEAGICEYNAGDGRSYVPLAEFSADTVSDFLRWAGRSPLDTKECVQCPALATCGGGCAYDSQELLGDALAFDTWLCETNVAVVRWMMQDLLSQLQDRLRGRDFHVVTAPERALVLGGVALDGANVSMAHVVRHGEAACAGARCSCQCPAQPG